MPLLEDIHKGAHHVLLARQSKLIDGGIQMADVRWEHYPHVAASEKARAWLVLESNLGLAANTLDAYGRALAEYISFSAEKETGSGAQGANSKSHDVGAFIRRGFA